MDGIKDDQVTWDHFNASNLLESEKATFGILKEPSWKLIYIYAAFALGYRSQQCQSWGERSPKEAWRALYLHVKWGNQYQKIKYGRRGEEKRGWADCQKNEWWNRDRRHFRPNLDGFCPCGRLQAT